MSSPSPADEDFPMIKGTGARVSISPWVNEKFPPWEELLSAHDVARLVRRPRWMLPGLILLRGLPKRYRYHGRRIGWLRSELVAWLARDLHTVPCKAAFGRMKSAIQLELPLRRCTFRYRRNRRRRCRRTLRG